MATLYLDFENGNDDYAGTSFNTLADNIDGQISGSGTSRTFSSAGASFPDDGSLIGQYLSIYNGSIYAVYEITAWLSSTSLTITQLSGGTSLVNQSVDRQYYIGGRWKSTGGATAVRTVPGDTIRIMGSPAPTSLGINGTWTSQALQGTKSLTAATNATPIAITVSNHGYSTGDTVVITSVNGNTAANGTWEITVTDANTFTLDNSAGNGNRTSGGTARLRNNTRVMLASAVTQNIASTGPGRTAWTQSTNVTTSLNTTLLKEHNQSDGINILTAFTTGKAAYYALPSTLDLSGYQQLSFWIRQETGPTPIPAERLELRLCSDAAGDTAVNTISIPASVATGRWSAITVDLGSALGSSIASISLWVTSDISVTANTQLYLNNIIACKASSAADSLTLTSLIGKNTTGETWWGIQSINGTRVMLDADTNATPTSTTVRGYYGTSETVTTWKRETIKLGPSSSSGVVKQTIEESGTDGSPITYSGGWDRTAMSTQNLETWLDGVNGNGYLLQISSKNWIAIDKLAFTRCNIGFYTSSSNYISADLIAINNTTSALYGAYVFSGTACDFTLGHGVANGYGPLLFGSSTGASSGNVTINHAIVSNGAVGIVSTPNGPIASNTIKKGTGAGLIANNSLGLQIGGNNIGVYNLQLENNSIDVSGNNNLGHGTVLFNCQLLSSNEVSANGESEIFSHNHDNVSGNYKIFSEMGLVTSATDQRKTASGISWKMQPTSSTYAHSRVPLPLSLAKVACAANAAVTIKAWMRRDNTGLTMRLVCKGGQIAGVASDVVSSMTADADTWEELTITFTPTEVGVVEITAEAWGGTTYSGWVDDMTISQA